MLNLLMMPEIDINRIDFLSLADDILSHGHVLRFRARGLSMRPFVRDGDILVVHPWKNTNSNLGDILLYQTPPVKNTGDGRIFVHRLVGKRNLAGKTAYQLQGDALIYPDALVFPERIMGRAVQVERGSRSWRLDTPGQRYFALFWVYVANLVKFIFRVGITAKHCR
jgi:hypothetical protein